MVDPTLEVAIDRTSIDPGLGPITLIGTAGRGGWGILAGWQLPGLQPQTRYADSDRIHGTPATSFKWIDGIFSGTVTYEGEDQAELQAACLDLGRALGRLSYPVVTTWNGYAQTWRARPGSLTPSAIDFPELRDNQPVFSISIPVHPIWTPGGL